MSSIVLYFITHSNTIEYIFLMWICEYHRMIHWNTGLK